MIRLKEIGKILVYLVLVVVLGALLAPPLYWAGNAIGSPDFLRFLTETPFQRYFNRAVLIAAVLLLWPMIRWLDVHGLRESTMQRDPHGWRNLAFGFGVSIVLMGVLGSTLLAIDHYRIRDEIPWLKVAKVFPSAAGASIAEEFLFRGAILALALRAGSKWGALAFTSALYSIVHFLKSPDDAVAQGTVNLLSGFALIPRAFWQFQNPVVVLGGFTTLFALGWVLGEAALRTRSLWLPIGIHAGMIVGKFGFTKIARRRGDESIWFGKDLEVGLGALLVMLILWGIIRWWLRHENRGFAAGKP